MMNGAYDSDAETLFVKAGDGRHVDFHSADRLPGAVAVRLLPDDPPIDVPNTLGIRRMIIDGDLVLVDKHKHEQGARVDAILAETTTAPVAIPVDESKK